MNGTPSVFAASRQARSALSQFSAVPVYLSPDGSRVVYGLAWEGQGSRIYTAEIGAAQPRPVVNVDGSRHRLGPCNWVSNTRLVCTLFGVTESLGVLATGSRLMALDMDGTNVRVLGQTDTGEQAGFRLWGGVAEARTRRCPHRSRVWVFARRIWRRLCWLRE